MNSKVPQNDILETLINYKNITRNDFGISHLLKDDIFFSFLIYVLDDKDKDIVTESLNIIFIIASKPQYINYVKNITNINNILKHLQIKYKNEKTLNDLAYKIFKLINGSIAKDIINNDYRLSNLQPKNYLQNEIQKSKTFELSLNGLLKDNLKQCQEALLNLRGIISFTFNIPSSLCIVRTKILFDPHVMLKQLNNIPEIKAHLLVKNEFGEKVILQTDDDYLDNDKLVSKSPPSNKNNQDICKKSDITSDMANKASGWFKSAYSFINDSFYW